MIFLVAVAALLASKPASASLPSRAVVSSIEKPKALATGPTVAKEASNLEKSSAVLVVATAKVANTPSASEASLPNILRAAPENAAALAKSVPTALANFSTPPSMSRISWRVKPSFANSICRLVTWAALYEVVEPNWRAAPSISFISSLVADNMPASFEFSFSKSITKLKALRNDPVTN